MPVYGLLSPQNANASGSIFDAPQPAPGLLSPPPPQSPDAALAVMNAAIRDAGAAMQRRRDSENAGRPAGSLLNMLPPASANSNGSLPDWFGTMPEFAKRNYLLSLADLVSNQSSGVVQPLTSFLLGLMGAASPAGGAANSNTRAANIPEEWRQMFHEGDQNLGLPPGTTERQIGAESSFNPNASNPSGAVGLAQIMPDTLAEAERALGRKLDRKNPRDAIDIRNWDLGRKLNARNGNLVEALRDYGGFISKEKRYSAGANSYVTKSLGEHWIQYDHPGSAGTGLVNGGGGRNAPP